MQLGWDPASLSMYTSGVGMGYFLGGPIAARSIAFCGRSVHTTLAHIASLGVFGSVEPQSGATHAGSFDHEKFV